MDTDRYPEDIAFEDRGTFYFPDVQAPSTEYLLAKQRWLRDETDDGNGINEHEHTPIPRSAAVRSKNLASTTKRVKSVKRVGKNSQSRIMAREKQRKALQLRQTGWTYQQIAEAVGYHDASAARKAVVKSYDEIIQEDTVELRRLQIERLNLMLSRVWARVNNGDESAIRTALSIMDRIDAIKGTHAPEQIETKNINADVVIAVEGNQDDYIAALRKMAGVDVEGRNLPDGQVAALPGDDVKQLTGRRYPPGMGTPTDDESHIVDAEVVEDERSLLGDVQSDRTDAETEQPKFDFRAGLKVQ